MKIIPLRPNHGVYRCINYMILGDWNRLNNINTLIDAGGDEYLLEDISKLSTGVGKKAVEQIILTHSHFDHKSGLRDLVAKYSPRVYANKKDTYVTNIIKQHDIIHCGDRDFIVYESDIHSQDSICLYNPDERIIFSGDTPLFIKSQGGTYTNEYLNFLQLMAGLKIEKVYTGHDYLISGNIGKFIERSIEIVSNSKLL